MRSGLILGPLTQPHAQRPHSVETEHVHAQQDSILDWLTAIGTVGAAVAAVIAIAASQAALRAERRHQRFRERYRDAVDLLAAFEAVRAAIPRPWDKKGTSPSEQNAGPPELTSSHC